MQTPDNSHAVRRELRFTQDADERLRLRLLVHQLLCQTIARLCGNERVIIAHALKSLLPRRRWRETNALERRKAHIGNLRQSGAAGQ